MTETRRDMPFWRRMALPASLVLNLFLIALIGGHLLRHDIGPVASASPLARALANAEATLSAPDAAAFGAVIRRDLPRYAKSAHQLEEARAALARQIVTEPYDPAAVRQDLTVWQTSWNDFLDNFRDTLADALAQISPDGRKRLIELRRESQVGVNP